jgi:CHASE1-domain containing sensor protein
MTGSIPFRGTTLNDTLKKVIAEDPPAINSIESEAPPELVAICKRAMEKESTRRYQSAADIVADLERFQSGALVGAHTYSIGSLIRLFVTKHRPVVITAAAATVLLVALGWYSILRIDQERDEAIEVEFQRIVDERVASFERELSLNIELLFTIHSLFEASDAVSHESFARVADGVLSRHPSVQALEWIPRIAESERRKAESSRRDLFPNFQITERVDGDTMIRAGRRDEYFPVYFVEPYEGNEAALGYDLASSPIRLAALRESRDEGSVRLTASVTLVQEQQSQLGFLGFVPVYSEKPNNVEERRRFLRGFALGVYRIGDIFEASALAQGIAGIEMILVDETTAGSPEVLYWHRSRSGEEPLDDISYRRSVKDLGGRQWVLVASPTPMFFEGRKSALPILALAIGVLLTAGLVAYVLFQCQAPIL